MSHSNSPENSRKKNKDEELQQTVNALFVEGVKAGVAAARDIIAEGFSETYEFESLILHRLHIIDAEHRILRGSDIEKAYPVVIEEARALLAGGKPSEAQYIDVSVRLARTAYEAWVIHRELTSVARNSLSAARRGKLADAIAERFPE